MFASSARVCGFLIFFSVFVASWLPQFHQFAQSVPSDEVPIQVIIVRTPEEAQQVLVRLNKGEDFATLAKELSTDPTAESGGFVGKFAPNSLRAELRNALAGVQPGQLSTVAHIPSGYAILKIMKDPAAQSPGTDQARSFALSATGAIKYAPDVHGLSEAETAILRFPKAHNWNSRPSSVCDLRKQSMATTISRLKAMLAPTDTSGFSARPPIDIMQAHFGLAQLYAYQGEMDPAIAEYQASYRLAQSDVTSAIPQMEEALGIIYLHKAEMENDAYLAPKEKCIFPMRPESAYKKPENSRKALAYFLKYLDQKPNEIEVLWLLNVTYMTLGEYPSKVPEKYLLAPSYFESKENIGRFIDIAPEIGLHSFSAAGGIVIDDFQNDGLFDIVASSFESCGAMHYFRNNGDGTFSDQTAKSGLGDQVGGLNMIQADYNNDGCTDILLLRGAWEFPQRKSLLRNNCDGTFTDVTEAAGLADSLSSTQAAVWADINNDGLLDLLVVNETSPAQLFLNKGDGTFEDISITSGIDGDGSSFSKGVAAADYDGDGYVDFYVSNLNGHNLLFHNNHNNTFTEVSYKAGVPGTGRGFATWFFDYDNDGLPDIFATSYFASVEETVRTYLDLPHGAGTLKLYKNLGNGTFRDVTQEVHLDKVFMPMGANFGDVDNDGYLDIYLGTGNPSYASIIPNVLLRNHDAKYFVDITTSSGTGELHKGHAVAFADLSHNGLQDIVAEVGGATPGDAHALRVFKNPGNDNDWISLKLVGVKTNRSAIGAQIKITVENAGQGHRSIYRTVGSGGSFGASPLEQHIGLGKSAKILSIDVFWPVSKTHQTFHDVAKNQFFQVKEFADQPTPLIRNRFQLGGLQNTPTSAPPAHSPEPAAKTQSPETH